MKHSHISITLKKGERTFVVNTDCGSHNLTLNNCQDKKFMTMGFEKITQNGYVFKNIFIEVFHRRISSLKINGKESSEVTIEIPTENDIRILIRTGLTYDDRKVIKQ